MAVNTVFELPEFRPYQAEFIARSLRFRIHRRYYDGTMYNDNAFKLAHKLYAETKALLSFLARAVDLDVALVPGVMGPWELVDAPTAQIDAQKLLYDWSLWTIEGDDWLEDGATLGEAMVKVVPDLDKSIVKMDRLKPEFCLLTQHMDMETQQTVELAIIVDKSQKGADGNPYEYAEIITPAEIRTYWNGNPHGYNGNPDRYPNDLGFVPIVRTKNDSECRPTFHKCLPQVDSVNELASYLGNIIGHHAEPQWAAFGVEEAQLTKSGANVWYLPVDAKMEPLLAKIDVPGALEFITEIKGETKNNLPELAFDDLRAKDQIATETLEVQLVELDAKIWKMRRRYDMGLTQAHNMAALVALHYGIPGLEPLLAPHSMDYKRPVRPISRLDQIAVEQAELSLELQRNITGGEGMTSMVNTPAGGVKPVEVEQGRMEG